MRKMIFHKASIWFFMAAASVLAVSIGPAGRFLRVDACIDRGGVYDYSADRCRFDVQQLPVPKHQSITVLSISMWVFAGCSLTIGLVVTLANRSHYAVVGNPHNVQTFLRSVVPHALGGLFPKGLDCEAVGSRHRWYNIDGATSGCYHCEVRRAGQLWRK
jgi:hypothetical protein